jgi:hypothetical protein
MQAPAAAGQLGRLIPFQPRGPGWGSSVWLGLHGFLSDAASAHFGGLVAVSAHSVPLSVRGATGWLFAHVWLLVALDFLVRTQHGCLSVAS